MKTLIAMAGGPIATRNEAQGEGQPAAGARAATSW